MGTPSHFRPTALDPQRGACLHRRIQAHSETTTPRQPQCDSHRRDDRSGRRRLGCSTIRPQGNGEGKIHLVARATDAALVRGQTIRVLVANADALVKRKEIIERFMKAYRESIDYLYSSNPQVMKDYAEFARVSEPLASACATSSSPRAWSTPIKSTASTL